MQKLTGSTRTVPVPMHSELRIGTLLSIVGNLDSLESLFTMAE
jgi:hypothetical protein